MLKNKYFLIAGGIVILILGYYGYGNFLAPKPSPYLWTEAKVGDIREIVSETGIVKAAKEINLNLKNSGTVREVRAKVGDSVRAGSLLIQFDTLNLEIQARQARANRDSAKAKLDLLLAGASSEDVKIYETAVANAKDSLSRAKNNLQNVEASAATSLANAYKTVRATMQGNIVTMATALTDADNILGADNTLANDTFENYLGTMNISSKTDAEAAYSLAKRAKAAAEILVFGLTDASSNSVVDQAIVKTKEALSAVTDALAKTKTLLDNSSTGGGFTLSDLSTKKTTIDTDRTSVNTGSSTLDTNNNSINSAKLTNQTNIDTAQTAVTTAEGALATAEDQLALKKAAPREADINYYTALVNQAEASLDLILNQISESSLRSPVDGVITAVNFEKGETVPAVATTPVVSLISSNNFEIEADVSELDINKIKINDPADVTIDAVAENKVFPGKVVQVDPAEIVKDSDIYYRIKVILDDKTIPLKSGMTADINIVANNKSGVIIIPERAVIKEGGKKKVRLLVNEELNIVEVETGLKGEELVEIISGVTVGDKVVTYIKE